MAGFHRLRNQPAVAAKPERVTVPVSSGLCSAGAPLPIVSLQSRGSRYRLSEPEPAILSASCFHLVTGMDVQHRRLTEASYMKPAILASLLLLSACAPPGERLTLVNRQPPAELVQACPAEPVPPPDSATDGMLALWIQDVRVAGQTCRAKHRALADWAAGRGVGP